MASVQPMFHMRPVYHANTVKELPDCMYKMRNICAASSLHGAEPSSEVKDLVARQDAIISKLEGLKYRIESLSASSPMSSTASSNQQFVPRLKMKLPKSDLVISCNPAVPARAVLYLIDRMRRECNVLCTFYTHSSASEPPCVDLHGAGFQSNLIGVGRGDKDLIITWIWKDCDDIELIASPIQQTKIVNEANVCRYLMRLLGDYPTDPVMATVLDQWLDMATSLVNGSNAEKATSLAQLAKHLAKHPCIAGNTIGMADILICSVFIRSVSSAKWLNDANLKQWSASVKKNFNA